MSTTVLLGPDISLLPSCFRVSVTHTHTPLIAHPWEFGPVFPLTPSLMETAYIPFLMLLL